MIIILIPAYNEEKSIGSLLRGIEGVLGRLEVEHRILVVDDGSTDRTPEVLADLEGELPLEVIRHPENRNLGGAMKSGFARVLETGEEGDFLITLDADNTHPPEYMVEIYDRLLDGPDVVVASRYAKGGEEVGLPAHRALLSKGANALFRLLFPIEGVTDYTGSYRGYRVSALRKAWGARGAEAIREEGFTVMPEILLTLRGKGLVFAEVPLVLRYDLKGEASKMRVARNVFATLRLMLAMRLGGRLDPQ